MNADRLSLFCDAGLAERIEWVETQLVAKGCEAAHRRAVDSGSWAPEDRERGASNVTPGSG